jgi:hypothetical protein
MGLSLDHKELAGLLRALSDEQLFRMDVSGEFTLLSYLLTTLGSWAKEPDAAWSPESTGNLVVVLEVGSSEPSQQLRIDAREWIESSGTTVESCITIDLSEQNNLTIDIWKLGRIYRGHGGSALSRVRFLTVTSLLSFSTHVGRITDTLSSKWLTIRKQFLPNLFLKPKL